MPETLPHLVDIATLSRAEVRRKHATSYDNWRNRKHGCKKVGGRWAPEWEDFHGFLADMGPRPGPDWSLDRIDSDNPDYGPGLCRWADKRGQANNRRTTIFLTYAGERLPLTLWADRTGQAPSTMRSRRDRGWTDREIVEGKCGLDGAGRFGNIYHFNFWPEIWADRPDVWESWETRYHATGAATSVTRLRFLINTATERLSNLSEELAHMPEDDSLNEQRRRPLDEVGTVRKTLSRATTLNEEVASHFNRWLRRMARAGCLPNPQEYKKGNPRYVFSS